MRTRRARRVPSSLIVLADAFELGRVLSQVGHLLAQDGALLVLPHGKSGLLGRAETVRGTGEVAGRRTGPVRLVCDWDRFGVGQSRQG